MLVHLLSAFPVPPAWPQNFAHLWLGESAREDPFGIHQVTDDPATADLILFVEQHPPQDPYALSILWHPVYRRYRDKCFLYHDADYAVAVIRGIYPSIRHRDYQAERCRSGGYIARLVPNDAIRYEPVVGPPQWLYSFFGAANSPVRRTLLGRPHPQGLIRDSTGKNLWELSPEAKVAFMREYAEAIRDSQFVLCPGGIGPVTYRLFETMEMGRVPVIISDEWVPPHGPAWEEFSLRIPENRLTTLEALLAEHAPRHEEMGRKARLAWEQWYAKPVCFHRMVEQCLELKAVRPGLFSALRAWCALLRAPHLRTWLRPFYHAGKRRVKSAVQRS
jgi:hypothetical protein